MSNENSRLRRRGGGWWATGLAVRSLLTVGVALGLVGGHATHAAAQEGMGRITGRVVSEQTSEGLATAQVFIDGTSLGTLTDLDGRYLIPRVPAGTHDVIVQLIGYARKTVTGVQVRAGGMALLDISIAPQAIEMQEITVTAEAERGSTAALLSERKRAPVVVDAIGSEQIDRSPDSDAASALKRVPGISVVDGKYVYVRGLGERYGSTTLNGAPLPSSEPDKKVIPLDLIPASFLESVATAKTYTPDQPGDYAGGLVQIQTRAFPSIGLLKLKTSVGLNTNASLRDGLGYRGGDFDFFGFDDGTRDLPSLVPSDQPLQPGVTVSAAEAEQIGEAFIGSWGPVRERHPVDQSFGLTFGNELALGEKTLGFFGSLTHSSSYSYTDDLIERVFSSAGGASPDVDYSGQASKHAVSLGGLFNASLRLAPTHRISIATVYSRSVDDEARTLQGFNLDSSTDQLNTRLRYVAQSLLNTQLSGQHLFGWLLGSTVSWRAGYSRAMRYEPNTREVLYRQDTDGVFRFDDFVQSGSIFHQDLVENGWSGAVDWKIPFGFRALPASLGLGVAADVRERDAFTRRFRFRPQGAIGDSVRALSPNELFSPATIAADSFQIQEATFRPDNYDAEQSIYATYAMLDVELLPRLRLVGGARVEQAEQTVTPRDLFPTGQPPLEGTRLDDTDVLPGVNLTYAVAPEMNLRAGFSRTLARPQLRELAPFSFADYAGGYLVAGNPLLERSTIHNYDLRWEWFLAPGAVLSLGGFYKRFNDPIEVFVFPSTELFKSWVNAEKAENYGAELEVRSSLGLFSEAFRNFYLNTNLTLVESDVTTGQNVLVYLAGTGSTPISVDAQRNRPLQGQSPYVVNVGLTYAWPGPGTSATVLYNRFGRRVDAVSSIGLDDIYEEARDQLDVVVEQRLFSGFEAKLSANRLLGNEIRFTQGNDLLRSFDVGQAFSFSLTWSPGGSGGN